ncbi:MAG: 4'-phosphopantetheinyl transferase superfamily protein [Bacteroidaceae bacterium]|nr:4'-phosphopantetheinyl transferase superfamily protein [Bacteroidaceae bacterium]
MNDAFQFLTPLLDASPELGVRVLAADVTPLQNDELFGFSLARISDYRRRIVEETKNRQVKNLRLGVALLLDSLLGDHGLHECEMDYTELTHGKPVFKRMSHIAFNLSHSGTVAAAALMPVPFVTYGDKTWKSGKPVERVSANIGLDVQKLTHGKLNLAKTVFSAEEQAAISQSPTPDEDFTRLWARHESHVKATGEGVGRPLPPIPAEARIHEYTFDDYHLSLCIL